MPESPQCSVTCTLADWLRCGPALVRLLPTLASVRLSDREPEDAGYGHGFYFGNPDAAPDFLPDELLDLMAADAAVWVYASAAEAHASLSAACLAWARQQPPSPHDASAQASLSDACLAWARQNTTGNG